MMFLERHLTRDSVLARPTSSFCAQRTRYFHHMSSHLLLNDTPTIEPSNNTSLSKHIMAASTLPSPVDFGDFDAEAADEALYESTYVISSHSDYAEYFDRIDPADPFSLSEEQTFFLVDEHFEYCHGPSSSKKRPPTTWTFDEEGKSPTVTFNEASSDLWRGAQVELNAIRDNIVKKAGLSSLNEYDPIRHSVRLFFGESTAIGDLLKSSLATSRKKVLQFLATYAF